MTSAPYDIPEPSVALRTGLSGAEIKKRRGPADARWQRGANGRVMWSAAGVAALEAELAAQAQAMAPPEPVAAGALERFTVVRARNARTLHVVREGEAYDPNRPRCVWLPRPAAHLFRPGMAVLARPREGRHWWDFEGNPDAPEKGRRLPRAPGRW